MWTLLLLLAGAASASAEKFDTGATGFWTTRYRPPISYCRRVITIDTPHVLVAAKASSPCKFRHYNGGIRTICHASREDGDRILDALKRHGTIMSLSQKCDPSPEVPELYFKRDILRREWEGISTASASMPGISNLIEAQLNILEESITGHETALQAYLVITITSSEKIPPLGDTEEILKNGTATTVISPPWKYRRPGSPCRQAEGFVIILKKTDAPMDARRIKAIQRLGAPYDEPDCAFSGFPGFVGMIFSTKSAEKIQKAATELSDMQITRSTYQELHADVVSDDRRFEMLMREVASNGDLLLNAPHVREFIDAQIEQLKPMADRLHHLRKGLLISLYLRP